MRDMKSVILAITYVKKGVLHQPIPTPFTGICHPREIRIKVNGFNGIPYHKYHLHEVKITDILSVMSVQFVRVQHNVFFSFCQKCFFFLLSGFSDLYPPDTTQVR